MLARICVMTTTAALLVPAATSVAAAPPVGPLPSGQMTTVSTTKGTLVAIALPGRPASTGLVWRLARSVNAKVLRETTERNVGRDIIVVYKAVGPGNVTVAYGVTKGETRKAYKSVTYKIGVS